ncbi:MAG: cyclopropane-fatty-acyl-phospholipid synthase family protein [Thermoleophilia bacterium]|nr:cyclopropane-fatty-acyl-phospholipid synthase family protein [Thermoleophilia bacterium]MDH4346327.1 cyclopropane-fatty-acyl-phospholipid synthase family protein [Thermoleophilia bacterium]
MSAVDAVTRRLVFRGLERLQGGMVVLRWPDGRGRRFGDGSGRPIVVDVRRPQALWGKLGRRTRVGFGEAYVDGDWDCDDLVGLLSLLGRNLHGAVDRPLVRAVHAVQRLRPDPSQRQTAAVARDNIHAHYDLGNDLFALMLDPTMTYSCAYWERPGMTLVEAQLAKLTRVCEKLRLGPDDHLLEIGCGWGGLAVHAARETGCRVTGLTISPSQAALARERVTAAGLDGRVEIVERDYRELEGSFSRIASIEMIEAIGHAEYPVYFRAIDRLLAPDGIALVQAIGVPDERYERYRRTPNWIQQYVFPGSLLPSLEALAAAVARTRLMILGVEEIGIGYAPTLRVWRENIERHAEALHALGYDERFMRIWRFYLSFCEAGFAIRVLRDMQLVLSRPLNDTLPATPDLRRSY